MSSASLIEKRSSKKSYNNRNIETSSTSITSAPPTSELKHARDNLRSKDKLMMMRSKQRESLPDISPRKGNRSVRASNFELSSSANDFDTNKQLRGRQKSVPTKVDKSKIGASNEKKTSSSTELKDDRILELLKSDLLQQQKNTLVSKYKLI